MGRNGKRIKRIFIIINIVIVLVISYFAYNEYLKSRDKKTELTIIKDKYKVLLNDSNIDDEEIKEINSKINDLEEIGNKTKEKKEEVFKLASELESKIKKNETKKKIAYLTFDDGPYYNTYNVLKILKENHVKATFFTTNVNGEHCYDNKNYECHKLYKEYAKDNHTIANHTYTHGWNKGLYSSVNSFMDAIKKQEELIKSETGIIPNIARFPGGSSTPGSTKGKQMKQALLKAGYGWVDWTASDGDGGYIANTDVAWNNFTKSIGDKIEVVLFHDYDKKTTAILPKVIKYLREKNYILLPLFYESVAINKG